jgi:hypothetical protein
MIDLRSRGLLYGNDNLYYFLRYHRYLYERMQVRAARRRRGRGRPERVLSAAAWPACGGPRRHAPCSQPAAGAAAAWRAAHPLTPPPAAAACAGGPARVRREVQAAVQADHLQ